MKFVSNRDVAVGVENLTDAIKFFEDTLGSSQLKLKKVLEYMIQCNLRFT